MRAPRRLQELRLSISEARDELGHTLNRARTVTDIATYLGVGEESILEALECGQAYRAMSLYSPINDADSVELGDTLGTEDRGFELAGFAASLPLAMNSLTDRERRIITCAFTETCRRAASPNRPASPRCTSPACSPKRWPSSVRNSTRVAESRQARTRAIRADEAPPEPFRATGQVRCTRSGSAEPFYPR